MHTGAPEVQLMEPLVQGFPVGQVAPAEQGLHDPMPSHTPPAQAVPAPTSSELLHTGAPVLQSVAPLTQAVPVEHDEPM